ncbi:hypothetical protein C8J57DRAFT_1359749 [Mycena rebaudengoi]|nr:hypothetical protein C8J57DRAFT_1369437 [Mycena rebaudengoi]KAJ7246976.1 hypothetical protein C8J57DRAFT_1359749 [Mycena rebaudengoi]
MCDLSTSPFSERLGTNYCPLDSEIDSIRKILVDPCLELKRLDHELTELEAAIDRLRDARKTISAYVDAHSALLSPFRRMPLDIVQAIFVACLPTDRNAAMSATEAPILLGRICSSWRMLSLSTPRLWASLHIAIPPAQDAKLALRLEVMKTWLRRSGSCPLSVSIHHEGWHADFSEPFMNELGSLTSRWQAISLAATPSVLKMLGGLKHHDLPMLEEVALFNLPEPFNFLEPPEPLVFLQSSRIRSVTMHGNAAPIRPHIQWEHLTHLSITIASGFDPRHPLPCSLALEILAQCPNLAICRFHIDGGSLTATGPMRPNVVAAQLTSLIIHAVQDSVLASAVVQLIRHLTIPKLNHLTILVPPAGELIDLSQFLTQFNQLQSLHLQDNAFDSESLKTLLLHGLPSTIQHLQITKWTDIWGVYATDCFNDDVLTLLTPDPELTNPTIPTLYPCPALRTLRIDGCLGISDVTLLRFICARMESKVDAAARLKQVQINFRRLVQVDILPQLQPFIADGLEVTLDYPPPVGSPGSPWARFYFPA